MTDREFLAKAHIEPFETPGPGPTPHPADYVRGDRVEIDGEYVIMPVADWDRFERVNHELWQKGADLERAMNYWCLEARRNKRALMATYALAAGMFAVGLIAGGMAW